LHAKLGHGKNFGMTRTPKRVESLSGVPIDKVACSEEATYCVSEQGDLYIFGSNLYGCLGVGTSFEADEFYYENQNIFTPTKHPFFDKNNLKVKSIASGGTHVICLTRNNRIFTWGCGEYGKLGSGDEDDQYEPHELSVKFGYVIKDVFAGPDATFLVTEHGRVFAFGNNENNKLCLNSIPIGFSNLDKKCLNVIFLFCFFIKYSSFNFKLNPKKGHISLH
jgi:alpha-tubulin suppressor-like RCC1 family protein